MEELRSLEVLRGNWELGEPGLEGSGRASDTPKTASDGAERASEGPGRELGGLQSEVGGSGGRGAEKENRMEYYISQSMGPK